MNGDKRIFWDEARRRILLLASVITAGGGISYAVAAADGAAFVPGQPVEVAPLTKLVSAADCVGVTVDLTGQVLWTGTEAHELFLDCEGHVLRVRMNSSALPKLKAGDEVRLSGQGLAGQGLLDEALADNDGLHGPTENAGTIFLEKGMQPFRAEWFNGRADALLELEYAGPHLVRQPVPNNVLFRKTGHPLDEWEQGLNYRCFQGAWEWLPRWRDWLPVKTGTVANLTVDVRTRSQNVGLEFSGYLKISEAGNYTFWTKSDDGSRLFIGNAGLQIQKTGQAPLPAPREIKPGQPLSPSEDCTWSAMEGLATGVHIYPAGNIRVELSGEQGRTYVELKAFGSQPPELFSRFRAVGLCRVVQKSNDTWIAGRLMASDFKIMDAGALPVSKAAVTSLAQLRQLAMSGHRTGARVCLTGMVMSAMSPGGLFAFQDDTGGVLVQWDLNGESLSVGERIVLRGMGAMDRNRFCLTPPAVVDNNGLHLRRERAGAMYLRKDKIPLHVSWFNRSGGYALELQYQGPGISLRKIPSNVLFHAEVDANGSIKWVPGLNFVAYRGDWQNIPKTSELNPVAVGVVSNLDAQVVGPTDKLGVEFSGFLEVLREGQYGFALSSDDGAQLFLDEQVPTIERLGKIPMPPPVAIIPRQILDTGQNYRWAEVEGVVNYAFERDGALVFDLGSDYGPMSVELADATDSASLLLLGSRVKLRGFCEGGLISAGQGIAANFIVPSIRDIEVTRAAPAQWNRPFLRNINGIGQGNILSRDEVIVHVLGEAEVDTVAGDLRLKDDSGSIVVKPVQPLPTNLTGKYEVLGKVSRSTTNISLSCALLRKYADKPEVTAKEEPPLTKILQIKQLPRERAQSGVPVKIRGVITLVRGSGTGFIIQDDTSAIDVWWSPHSNTSLPRVGDFWEVEGNTFVEFSPNVRVKRALRLGAGVVPEPLRPDWDQLLNGSLDTRYVELQGIVTSTATNAVTLLTRSGKINVLLSPVPTESLTRYQNALVRIRGCVVPVRNEASQQVQIGQTRLSNVSLGIDEPAPEDPFSAVLKHPADLLLFDARAGSLQSVKIKGQALHVRGNELFFVDGTNSVRALLQEPTAVKAGDLVEVVGFPELGGASPVLREAVLRVVGDAALPAPRALSGDALFARTQDGALITLEARLIGVSGNRLQKVLELQSGNRDFVARVPDPDNLLAKLVNGSRLQLTGVYAAERGRMTEQALASFELLLNSPSDVRVLERPPWWTPQRVLVAAGLLGLVIFAGAFWIVLLHRRVEEAAARLAAEVRHREKIQQQGMLERERTRIAKDMHDQLGTNVTQVGLLAELTKKDLYDAGKTALHADQISQRAVELGRTLDEIVWAVNPKNDSLDKFCDYMAVHAQELFQLTDVLCRVDLPPEMPEYPLSADVRHNLFLATKESLNNIVRHAHAKEVWVRFKLEGTGFQISIVDDGQGFVLGETSRRRNGLINMRKRLEDIGGRFVVESEPGHGTEVKFIIPLTEPADEPAAQRQTEAG